MACLTFFTSFSVSVFKASKTLKLMIVTHFQKFFKWPGAPKKEPKGQPDFIFCVSFFDLGPNGVQGGSRRCPREPKRGPGGPKRGPREAKGDPKGIQGNQKGAQWEPGVLKREPRRRPGYPKRVLGDLFRARWRGGCRQLDPPRYAESMGLGVLDHRHNPQESGSEENPYPSLAIVWPPP